MKIKNKKAYMHTLEAFLAFFVTFVFVVFIIAKGIPIKADHKDLGVLSSVEQRDDFRTCVYAENTSCAENLVAPLIPASYNHKISINSPAPFKGSKDVYTESAMIVSNQTSDFKIVYLYYWLVSG